MVPGLLKEKCVQLIKNLPRTLRKNFVPVPDVVDSIFPKIEQSDLPLLESLSRELKFKTSVEVPLHAWNPGLIDQHLRFNIEIVDDHGKVIEAGRDLSAVVEKVDHLIDAAPKQVLESDSDKRSGTSWVFGDLEEYVMVKQAGIEMKMFPALKDCGEEVERVLVADESTAQRTSRQGLAKLFKLRLGEQLSLFPKTLPRYKEMGLLYATIGKAKALYEDFELMCVIDHFSTDEVCRSAREFDQRFDENRGDFLDKCTERAALVHEILKQNHALLKQLKGKMNLALALPMSDLQRQLDVLMSADFLIRTPFERLIHFPRYLEACAIRLEKMPRELGKEREYVPKLKEWFEQYEDRRVQFERQGLWDARLDHFRWLIEEQRVSWYAQQLKTAETVSEKRLNRYWEEIRRI